VTADLADLTAPTRFLDHDHPVVGAFVRKALGDPGDATDIDKAVKLYYAVRDGIRYDVYDADLSTTGLTASAIISRGKGFCVHKSIVYAAAVRAVGIPSRIVYGDVRNHLASPRLRELVGGDIFRFHSLASVHLDGRWVKATPVFNKLLCKLYGMAPLEFDGRADSLYHPFDGEGRRHMEFLKFHGDFDDVPYDLVVNGIRQAHPRLLASSTKTASGSLTAEAAAGS
jgi:transglutaminase-like putative cysteine protease